jgi:hypothetical protein
MSGWPPDLAVDQHLVVGDGKRQTIGETTDANAQLQAFAEFGVSARLVQNADVQLIEQQINPGMPVPCGYIHRRPVERPAGSVHWLIVGGTTLNTHGMGLRFSRLNLGKGWQWWWMPSAEACAARGVQRNGRGRRLSGATTGRSACGICSCWSAQWAARAANRLARSP